MIIKKTLVKFRQTQFVQVDYFSNISTTLNRDLDTTGKLFYSLESPTMNLSQTSDTPLSLKVHYIKRYPALYSFFKEKEANLVQQKQDVPGSIHEDDLEMDDDIIEESKDDNSQLTQNKFFDFAKKYSVECSITSEKIKILGATAISKFQVISDNLLCIVDS